MTSSDMSNELDHVAYGYVYSCTPRAALSQRQHKVIARSHVAQASIMRMIARQLVLSIRREVLGEHILDERWH